jgi:hypothetical protein
MKTLELKQVRIDGGTQPRVEINQDVVADYAEQLQNGAEFPPVTVFFDGVVYWLADGFHRYHSHRQAGRDAINADVREGSLRDAILYSVGANSEHGLRRTNDDKRKAVETMLTNEVVSKDENGKPWSNCAIARLCHVDEGTVRNYRKVYTSEIPKYETEQRTFIHPKTGKPAVMNTTQIGKSKPKPNRQYGGIAPDAFKPVRPCGQYEPKAAIELPYKAVYAAKTIVSVMGKDLAVEIAQEILQIAKGN